MKSWLTRKNWLLNLLAFFICGNLILSFLLGFHPYFSSFFLVELVFWLLGFILSIVCFIVSLRKLFKREPILHFTIAWLLLTFLNFIPGAYSSAAGAMTAIYLAGSEQVVEEGRLLLQNYQRLENVNCDYAFPPCGQTTEYTPAIERVYPIYIRVTDDYVLIKKFGFGDFAGFLIYPDGVDPPGIKLRDGLYWIDAR